MLRMMDMAPADGGEHDHRQDDHDHGGHAMYTCPMHPEVRSTTPDRCPKCGMDLVPEDV